jgi:protein-S-isoprenylcysteine O-methyltransferase Ste14
MENAGFNIWDWLVCFVGGFCLISTGMASVYFWRFRKNPMGHAIFIDMVAEFCACLFAMAFTIDAVLDSNMPPQMRGVVRVLIFVCLVFSSLHLAYQTRKAVLTDNRDSGLHE